VREVWLCERAESCRELWGLGGVWLESVWGGVGVPMSASPLGAPLGCERPV
jgi:hypothetical protein